MGDLARRDKSKPPLPVQTRRADQFPIPAADPNQPLQQIPPVFLPAQGGLPAQGHLPAGYVQVPQQVIQIQPAPAPAQAPAPAPQPAPAQPAPQPIINNIIYVNPGGAAPAPAQPQFPTPQVVHHHHTAVHHPPRNRQPEKSQSIFGIASLLLGLAALAVHFHLVAAPVNAWLLALLGGVLGLLGLLSAIFTRRTAPGLPFAGLLICAVTVWLNYSTIQDEAKKKLNVDLPNAPQLRTPAAPAK